MYAKANQEQKAEEVFGEMKKGGLIPSTFTYNILLNMCAESGQVQRLEELFQEMKTQMYAGHCNLRNCGQGLLQT
jgi:pentatricopeptide repeat protein